MSSPLLSNNRSKRLCAWISEHKAALVVMTLLFIEHLAAMLVLKFDYNLASDDMSYVRAGAYFIDTGIISCHENVPSAQIMPGIPVLLGMFSLIFGEGKAYWIAAKLFWGIMGVLTAWFTYRIVTVFAPKWAGVLAMIPYFRPDIVWMNNTLLTETPFMLFLSMMVYYTIMMGKDGRWRYFWGCAIAYMCALLLKANIALYPILALIYLLIVCYDRKKLLKQIGVLACIVLMFVVPWSIRNYNHYNAFIPLSYGSGNPMLLGTYQGYGYPPDEALDYETNVDAVVKEKYADFYLEDGTLPLEYNRYVSLQRDSIKANYRISKWIENDFTSFAFSYAVEKPMLMIKSYFYWDTLFGIEAEQIGSIQWLDIFLCVTAIALSLALKRMRLPVLFLSGVYIFNILIYSVTFAFSRYNASLMCLRFALVGFAFYLIVYAIAMAVRTINSAEA